jgi:hypothetical protein
MRPRNYIREKEFKKVTHATNIPISLHYILYNILIIFHNLISIRIQIIYIDDQNCTSILILYLKNGKYLRFKI